MMVKDEWVRAAMTDDAVVVELLVWLRQSKAVSSPKSSPREVVPLRWGLRQPRSRLGTLRCDAVSQRKEADSTRCSPTTPLSWSGGASPSATADGFEDSSLSHAAARSKGNATNESTASKRSKRKKTFAELKEEESSLLKERIYLRKEIATLRATFKDQRARNESLKKMKVDLGLHPAKNLNATSYGPEKALSTQPEERVASNPDHVSSTLRSTHATHDDCPQSDSCEADKAVSTQGSLFFLPDLNMIPTEDDSASETLYGMS